MILGCTMASWLKLPQTKSASSQFSLFIKSTNSQHFIQYVCNSMDTASAVRLNFEHIPCRCIWGYWRISEWELLLRACFHFRLVKWFRCFCSLLNGEHPSHKAIKYRLSHDWSLFKLGYTSECNGDSQLVNCESNPKGSIASGTCILLALGVRSMS